MELVGDEEFRAGLALGVEHRSGDVDEDAVPVFGALGGDQVVCAENVFADFRARGALFDREEDDLGLGQSGVDFGGDFLEITEDGFGGLAGLKVVFAGVDDDEARSVGENDAIDVKDAVGEFGAAEAAVDDRNAGEVGGEAAPAPNGGATDEDDGALGGSFEGVGLSVFFDFGRPFFRGGGSVSRKKERRGEKKSEVLEWGHVESESAGG